MIIVLNDNEIRLFLMCNDLCFLGKEPDEIMEE